MKTGFTTKRNNLGRKLTSLATLGGGRARASRGLALLGLMIRRFCSTGGEWLIETESGFAPEGSCRWSARNKKIPHEWGRLCLPVNARSIRPRRETIGPAYVTRNGSTARRFGRIGHAFGADCTWMISGIEGKLTGFKAEIESIKV